jgi:uncharacterized membrane protein YbaN (DUF454 family)
MDRGLVSRALYASIGMVFVAVGLIGVVVPILPSTGPFILAAWCFSRSSTRMERWVLGLPKVGPLVRDYRAGLGMPMRAKVLAIGSIIVACSLSAVLALDSWWLRALVVGLGAVGCVVVWRTPTAQSALDRPVALSVDGPD